MRLLEVEAREQENTMMRTLMKKYEDDDVVQGLKRKELIEKSKGEVLQANDVSQSTCLSASSFSSMVRTLLDIRRRRFGERESRKRPRERRWRTS